MNISEAIRKRIYELLDEHELSVYRLAYLSGISPSVISDCLRGKIKEPTFSTLIHICQGLNIQLSDFFDSDLFNDVETNDRFLT